MQPTQDEKLKKFIEQSVELSKFFKEPAENEEEDGFMSQREVKDYIRTFYPRQINLFIDLNKENPTILDSYYHDLDLFSRIATKQIDFQEDESTIIIVVDIDELVENVRIRDEFDLEKKFVYKNGREPSQENINSIIKANNFCAVYRLDCNESNQITIQTLHYPSF